MLREKERKKERSRRRSRRSKRQFTSEDECFKEPLGNTKIENEGNVDDGGNDGDDNK